MLLAIDVGNTNITLGIFQGERLLSRGRISTHVSSLTLRRLLVDLEVPSSALTGVIISSVVPKATLRLKKAFRRATRLKPLVLGENIKAPILNRYRVPAQVGQDRLVNAVAAHHLYAGPAIVVDFGTAITIDLVSARREYLGGLIVPGIGVALEALSSRAALLPKVELAPPEEFLGRDTVNSMRSGIFYGYGALCDGIVHRLKADFAPKAKVIGTGGHAPLISPYSRSIQIVNPDLTLQGLELIYRKKR